MEIPYDGRLTATCMVTAHFRAQHTRHTALLLTDKQSQDSIRRPSCSQRCCCLLVAALAAASSASERYFALVRYIAHTITRPLCPLSGDSQVKSSSCFAATTACKLLHSS